MQAPSQPSIPGGDTSLHDQGQKGTDRSKACIACRNSKTKCVPLKDRNACKSCYKHSRECSMPGPPKPRARTTHRFLELEKRVQFLTDALASQGSLLSSDSNAIHSLDNATLRARSEENGQNHELLNSSNSSDTLHFPQQPPQGEVAIWMPDAQTALMLINHYDLYIRPFLPLISLPMHGDLASIQSARPLIYTAVLVVASLAILPSRSSALMKHLNEQLACQVFIGAKQSLDLVQALLLTSHYFVPPEKSTNFILIQHAYTASVMAFDLGLDKQASITSGLADSERAEAARTWLAVYYTMSVSVVLLRRQQLVFNNLETVAIMSNLLDNPYAVSSDKTLCDLVRLQIILGDAYMTVGQLACDEGTEFDNSSTQYQVRALQQRLDQWKKSVSAECEPSLLNHAYNSAKLYIYQIAVRTCLQKYHLSIKKPGERTEGVKFLLSTVHAEALHNCLQSSQNILDTFISLPSAKVRCLPSAYLIWIVSTAVVMVKLSPFIEQQQSLNTDSTTYQNIYDLSTTIRFLDSLAMKLEETCENGHSSHERPFISAVKNLKVWHMQKANICLNDRQRDKQSESGVHTVLSPQDSHGAVRPLGSSYAVTSSQNSIHHYDEQSTLPQLDMSQLNSAQVSSLNAGSLNPVNMSASTDPFGFPAEADGLDDSFGAAMDLGTDWSFIDPNFRLDQFDESMSSYNEMAVRGLLGLDLMF